MNCSRHLFIQNEWGAHRVHLQHVPHCSAHNENLMHLGLQDPSLLHNTDMRLFPSIMLVYADTEPGKTQHFQIGSNGLLEMAIHNCNYSGYTLPHLFFNCFGIMFFFYGIIFPMVYGSLYLVLTGWPIATTVYLQPWYLYSKMHLRKSSQIGQPYLMQIGCNVIYTKQDKHQILHLE